MMLFSKGNFSPYTVKMLPLSKTDRSGRKRHLESELPGRAAGRWAQKVTETVAQAQHHAIANDAICAGLPQKNLCKNAEDRAVYLSFMLQRIGGMWSLTQAETSPDRIQKLG